ncbi:MAG TPA: PAS domain S-box protein [Deltaproteobacteria bacterium]|mgnify:CR=1 FL=1|nr:PAS domain S-box protein [Deltaproteobacteria bacterium]
MRSGQKNAASHPERETEPGKCTREMMPLLLNELPVAVVLYRDDGAVSDCNDTALRLFGYSRREMTELRHSDLLPRIFLKITQGPFTRENTTNGEFIWVCRRRKDGTVFQCEQSSKMITLDGQDFCLMCYRQSDSLSMPERNPSIESKISRVLTLDNPFCIQTWQEINGELHLIGFNPTLEEYTVGKIRDYTGRTVHEFYGQRGRMDVVDSIYEVYRNRGMLRIETFCDFLVTGNERHVDTVSFFVPPNMVVQYIEDITEQRKALLSLKESEERFKALFLGSPIPVMTWRHSENDFVLIEYNYALQKLAGEKVSDLLGAGCSQLFRDYPGIIGDMRRCFEEKTIVHRNTKFRMMLSGEEKLLAVTFAYVPNDLVLTHIHDITDQKKAEDELIRYQQELSNLYEKHLDILEHERKRISQELHDGIGQYLSTIKVSTENLLASSSSKLDREKLEERLRSNIALLKEAIIDVSRVSMDLRPSILDDLGLIATINWFLREYGKVYKDIKVEKDIRVEDSEIPQKIKIVVFRVLQESMNNIAAHSKASLVRIAMHKEGDALEFSVADNGRGFDLTDLQKSRCGLGIAGMRERVTFSQGRFCIESSRGKGTVIRITWHLAL